MVQLETETIAQKLLFTENGANQVEKPHGDGHSVIVIPPVGRSDMNMGKMRKWIDSQGFTAFESGIKKGDERDPKGDVLKIISRIDEVFEQTGQKITLVGLSLGGIYTFIAAMYRPEKVQRVILIGTPIRRHEIGRAHFLN